MMNPPEIRAFIRDNTALFWFTPDDKKENISEECLVETILNYGSLERVKQLVKLLGMNKTAQIFFKTITTSERRKNNYHELTINYFTHLFHKYAPQYSN